MKYPEPSALSSFRPESLAAGFLCQFNDMRQATKKSNIEAHSRSKGLVTTFYLEIPLVEVLDMSC